MSVFTNPDGTPRYTFSHSELVEHFTTNRGMTVEEVELITSAFTYAGAYDVAMDESGERWYTLVPEAREDSNP